MGLLEPGDEGVLSLAEAPFVLDAAVAVGQVDLESGGSGIGEGVVDPV
jgi:hypothetical protein